MPKLNRIWEQASQNALEQIKKQGVTVNQVSDKQEFLDRVSDIAADFLQTQPAFSREIYQKIKEQESKFMNP